MTATVDEGRPERAWGVAAVPAHRHVATPPEQPEPPAPAAPAATTAQSRRHHRAAEKPPAGRLRTFLALAVLLVAAGFGGFLIIRQRLADRAFVELGSVVLTAEAVPVGFADSVVVGQVNVRQHTRVTTGQELAAVTDALGRSLVGPGALAKGGEPIIMLYDSARLTFQAEVPLEQLRRMRLGMTTYIEGPGLSGQITATLDHVVPVVGSAPSDRLTVVLVPAKPDQATVSTLVPGLQFAARVDTNTAPDAVPAVNAG
jgi:hypothetical protein